MAYELKTTGDGTLIVDDLAVLIFLCKEHALVIGNPLCKGFVGDGSLRKSRGVQSSHVMPVTREAVPSPEFALDTKDVDAPAKSSISLGKCAHQVHANCPAREVVSRSAPNGVQVQCFLAHSRARPYC